MSEKELFIDPLTRLEGHIAIQARVDTKRNVITEAHSVGTMFRGYEVIMKGRDPPDAIFISQRICGVCPVPHGIAAAECLDMALNAPPPPLATLLRSLTEDFEIIYDHPLHFFQLAGPDYSKSVMEKLNPSWWRKAVGRKAEHRSVHGYETVGEIMEAMNPLGPLWLESLEHQKLAKECLSMLGGKHPHVATFVPGGITYLPSVGELEELIFKAVKLIAWTKKFRAIADDVISFLEEVGIDKLGNRKPNLISYGTGDDPESYNANYADITKWGEKRHVTPGVVAEGKLLTTDLAQVNSGIRIDVTHSYYDAWDGDGVRDPVGKPVPKEHPWNKETKPRPGPARQWSAKYSWVSCPRWVGNGSKPVVVEAGPISRMWTTAAAKKVHGSTGTSLKFSLPETPGSPSPLKDSVDLEWRIPGKVNVAERLRARVYYTAYVAHLVYDGLLEVVGMVKAGKTSVWTGFSRPAYSLGVGLTEAGRGALGHWTVVKDGKIAKYQIVTPSNINASPVDHLGQPGPYDEALAGSPIFEETPPNQWKGVDIARVIRSMDPCLACAVHAYTGGFKTMEVKIG